MTTADGPVDFRVGDEVMITRNDYRLEVLNGTRATVAAVTPDGLTMRTSDGREVGLDRHELRLGPLAHAYALTIHKAQGLTVDRALVWADPGLYQEAAYVALSRATQRTDLYLAPAHAIDEDGCGSSTARRRPVARDYAAELSRSHQHHLASDHQRDTRTLG